jgi:DNA-binding transcriptional LysR family regulator
MQSLQIMGRRTARHLRRAIARLQEIGDLDRDDDGNVIIGADVVGHDDLMSRIAAFLAANDQ